MNSVFADRLGVHGADSAPVLVAGTFDTKAPELHFVADMLRARGLAVRTLDVSTSQADRGADVPAGDIAAHHANWAAISATGDRGQAIAAMASALKVYVSELDVVRGMIGLGGSGGTALITPAMRSLPVGIPKIMVSTVASGNVAPYVGESDLVMMPSVTDVAGLNRISVRVLGNAANALAGMMTYPASQCASEKPAAGLTMFGVTTPCVDQVSHQIADAFDCLVFHATGTGGRAMEKLVESRLIGMVIDISTTEVADLIAGGCMAAAPERLGCIAATLTPYVGSFGACDMVNFGAMDTVPERYRHRLLYAHNPFVTLMRTNAEECVRIGEWLAQRLNRCDGEVRFLIPEGGVSAIDAPGQPFHDPGVDSAMFDAFEQAFQPTDRRQLIRLPYHINDPAFAAAVVATVRSLA